jgi:tRNA-splicing ligase RtcB
MGKDTYRGPLEQVDDCCWRIPKSYKQGMRVDGLIFANDKLIDLIRRDQSPEQVVNVAFLPGIQHASLAMPDIHHGYGFCIGGVCATDPDEGGVISPGGVGYDINCLTGEVEVLHAHGYTRPISEMAREWRDAQLSCFDLEKSTQQATTVFRWFGQQPRARVLQVKLASGKQVRATADHPFWTPEGMVPLGELTPGRQVGVVPFEGIPYHAPSDDVVVCEEAIRSQWRALGKSADGHGLEQTLAFLRTRGLLPLRYSSPVLPYLCKILGFVFGDGSLHFARGNGKGVTLFSGEKKDLEAIRADVAALGFTPSRVYARHKQHAITTAYKHYEFDRQEESFKVVGSGFAVLLACLGAPVGKKTRQDYSVPAWLETAPRWQKRLFLAAYFGAELTTPRTITGHDTVFAAPTLGLNKHVDHTDSGHAFLSQLSDLVAAFGVETQSILYEPPPVGKATGRWRLVLSGKTESLLSLWGKIGYEYNARRTRKAALALSFLQQETFEPFADFAERIKVYPTSSMVWDTIVTIEPVAFEGEVYDFTVEHPDHNFVANGFVVSNCGVRLVRSNLFYREVKGHLRVLVDELFRNIPTGVGRSGRYKFNRQELSHLMSEGPRYLQNRGLATASDIEKTEAEGRLDGADPGQVSDHAYERGMSQCGTLGSGNHFLEVQIVDHVYDAEAAAVMGLEKDMVCVMIHSGSRGLGYQVCDDALRMLRKTPEKYGISLPDRQLACAPVDSPEGQKYIAAMRAAANFAWCNRQLLMHQAREVFASVFGRGWDELQMNLVYDVCHNIAKFEEHLVDNRRKRVWVHRKGATRAFPPGHLEIPSIYRKIGQPVIIPGDMGRASWILVGQTGSMDRSFGTTCHGAGRAMSRTASVRDVGSRRIDKELESRGVIARAQSRKGLAEEQPAAYKDVDLVVEVVHRAGLSKKVARMRPIGVIKG